LNLCEAAEPPTNGYIAFNFVQTPESFNVFTNLFTALCCVELLIDAAVINA
jgi:hypothetical protein